MLKLHPNPTFKTAVKIPLPGGEDGTLTVEFKHMTVKQLADLHADGVTVGDVVKQSVCGWSLEDGFSQENLQTFMDNYHAAARSLYDAFVLGLTRVREGN